MKYIMLLLILAIVSIQTIGQINQPNEQSNSDLLKLTDTTVIVGQFTSKAYVGKIANYCMISVSNGAYIESNTKAFIIGFKECTNNKGATEYLYEVLIDSISYYAKIENVILRGYNLDQLKQINIEHFSKIKEYAYHLSKNNANLNDYDLVLIKQREEAKLNEQRREQARELNRQKKEMELAKLREEAKIIKQKEDSIQMEIMSFLKSCKAAGIALYYYYHYDESEYTDGTGIKFKFYNPTNKVIKYVWTTFTGINAVGDKVLHDFKKTYNLTVQSIGPIKSGEFGTYEYSYTWHNDIVEKVKIISIEVQYMDGSKKKILNPKSVMLDSKLLTAMDY